MLSKIIAWLAGSPASDVIQNVLWVIPAVQTLHILCVAVVLSSVGMIALRLWGLAGTRTSVAGTAARYVPWIWGALIVLALSGITLIVGEPRRELTNLAFQTKMVLLLCGIALIRGFQVSARRHPQFWERAPADLRLKLLGTGAVLLFFAIAVAGRWVAYMVVDYAA